MGGATGNVLVLLINTLGGLYILAVLLRFLLQASGADPYNPLSQVIVKATTPALRPFRKLIPGYRNIDFSALVLALVLNTVATALMVLAVGGGLGLQNLGTIISWAFVGLLAFILNIYFYALLISVIASWIAPYSANPALILVQQLMEPIQSLFRRILPPMGGLDLSPIFIFLGIAVLEIMLVQTFASGLRLNTNLVIGI